MFDKAMIDALKADSEKLNQLTGEDHTPEFLVDCEACGGLGSTEHSRYGGNDPDVWEKLCQECGGVGFFICEAKGD